MLVARHTVATTPINRHTQLELFGDGTPLNPGMTLAEFVRSTHSQADWFVEPTLTAADRDDLWALLRRTTEGRTSSPGPATCAWPSCAPPQPRTGARWRRSAVAAAPAAIPSGS